MNLLEAVRSGRRFRKDGGPWIDRRMSSGLEEFWVKMPSGKDVQAYFHGEDFRIDTWETEPVLEPELSRADKIMQAFDLLRDVLLESLGPGPSKDESKP